MNNKRQNTQSIGTIIQQVIRKSGMQVKLDEASIIDKWEDIVGKLIAKHTETIYVNNKKLFLRFNSAALKQEISYSKSTLIDNVNKEIGHLVVEDVIFL